MTPTLPLQIACPRCASPQVVYSCEPKCCFNHVCAVCRCTFQSASEPLGGKLQGLVPPDPEQDSSDPTVACSECKSIAVHTLADGRAVCTRCGSLLRVFCEDVDPA